MPIYVFLGYTLFRGSTLDILLTIINFDTTCHLTLVILQLCVK